MSTTTSCRPSPRVRQPRIPRSAHPAEASACVRWSAGRAFPRALNPRIVVEVGSEPGKTLPLGVGQPGQYAARDQQRPMVWGPGNDRPNSATPMRLWPEARRSPRVGIVGATPTPSTDTHATGRPAAASSIRCRKRRRRSGGKRDSAHVVMTTGRAAAGTRETASGSTSTGSPRSSRGGRLPPTAAQLRASPSAPAGPARGRRATTGRPPRRSRRWDRGGRRPGCGPRVSPATGRAGLPQENMTVAPVRTGRPAIVRCYM